MPDGDGDPRARLTPEKAALIEPVDTIIVVEYVAMTAEGGPDA